MVELRKKDCNKLVKNNLLKAGTHDVLLDIIQLLYGYSKKMKISLSTVPNKWRPQIFSLNDF